MPGMLDIALIALFSAVWPLVEYFVLWPRHVRAVDAGDPGARLRAYTRTLVEEWLLAAAVVAVMLGAGRSLGVLNLAAPHGWRLVFGAALPLAYLVLIVVQGRALAGRTESLAKLRKRLEPLRALVPHTAAEFRLFVPLSVTAGICEEFLFRGYLVWVLRAWIGLYPAAAASMVLFGLAHAYQGVSFGVRAFFAGVAMGVLALVTGSLLPGMALHALIDAGSGWITYMAMREPATGATAGSAA
ncbi:MAG TPA: CPBP family intramembrane glutamic endopeptidase [Candidatus Eisenbacteria bacterium]|jgi:membrane protease YdiL (CAAX protease family)